MRFYEMIGKQEYSAIYGN